MSFDVLAALAEATVTGLALTDFEVDVMRVTKSDNHIDQIVNAADMTMEVGDGHYAYYLIGQDFITYDYLVLVQYEGVIPLGAIVWTGKPLGDLPSPSAAASSFRRTLPRTLLTLDRWAQIIGLDPRHFRQITTSVKPATTCSKVWKQYSWQEADQVGRYDVADAIQQAERTIAQYLGYKLLPTWEVDERQHTPKPGNAELLRYGATGPRGFPLAVLANWGHFVEGGVQAKVIEPNGSGVGITYSDRDGDGYFETATVTINTTITDEEEIAVFYPNEGGADEWEIRPLREVAISGGVATITLWRHQLVDPDLIEALDPQAVNGATNASFLTTVDVYRRYNNPSGQLTLIWDPNNFFCNACGTATTCCPVCGQTTQEGCLMPKDYLASLLMYRAATYEDGEWSTAAFACNRNPDQLLLSYRAGLEDKTRDWPKLQMDSQWEKAVAYYALALLDRPVCDCAPMKGLSAYWREDLSRQSPQGGAFQLGDNVLNNPLGTNRAAIHVWNMIQEQGRRLAQPVRW